MQVGEIRAVGGDLPEMLAKCSTSWQRCTFEHAAETRVVFRAGSGPGVVVMHEVPGIHPAVAEFSERVVEAGFSVAMPDLFGTAGKEISAGYTATQMLRACVTREFHVLASPSPHCLSPSVQNDGVVCMSRTPICRC